MMMYNNVPLEALRDDHIMDLGVRQTWPWVGFIHGGGLASAGSEIFAYELGWVGFSCLQKLIIFFHYHNYPTA